MKKIALFLLMVLIGIGAIVYSRPVSAQSVTISPTPDTTDYCKPVNKTIKVTAGSEPGYCKDLQKAINSVNEDGVKIFLLDGDYTFPDTGDSFTLKIQNKINLEIASVKHSSPFDTKVSLHFPKNKGGILIENTSGNFGWIKVDGATNNGLLRVTRSNDLDLSNLHIQDSSALTVDIEDSKNIRVSASVVKSAATGLNAENVDNLTLGGNQFTNSAVGVQVKNITNLFLFKGNLVYANSQKGLYVINSTKGVKIQNNTFDKISSDALTADSAAVHLLNANDIIFDKNIIAQSPVGIKITTDPITPTPALLAISQSDFWNVDKPLDGTVNANGRNGNINTDPKFGEEWCLQAGSPAILNPTVPNQNGDLNFMGHRGPCGQEAPSPLPTQLETCLCKSDNTCDQSCTYVKSSCEAENKCSYATPIKCSRESSLGPTPAETNRNTYCRRGLRLMGDADGDGKVTEVDYLYYVRAVNGGVIPEEVNPDYNGDGFVSPSDRVIVVKTLAETLPTPGDALSPSPAPTSSSGGTKTCYQVCSSSSECASSAPYCFRPKGNSFSYCSVSSTSLTCTATTVTPTPNVSVSPTPTPAVTSAVPTCPSGFSCMTSTECVAKHGGASGISCGATLFCCYTGQ